MLLDRITGLLFRDLYFRLSLLERALEEMGTQMSEFATGQEHLDAAVAGLALGLGNIEVEIAALKAAAPDSLDFAGLDAAVARLHADTDADESAPVDVPVDVPVEPPVEEPV